MSDTIRKKAEAALAEVEKVTAVVLAEPKGELVTLAEADKPTSAEIKRRMDEIDMTDTKSIVSFGSRRTGRIAGDQPIDAGRRAQQGCRPSG